jgi:hypothetical protein
MSEDGYIPAWAFARVDELTEREGCYRAFARYVIAHEKQPSDPLWDEAYKLASLHHAWASAEECDAATSLALAALKRGIELTKAGDA